MNEQRSIRGEFERIFTAKVAKPSWLCWDALALASLREFYGGGLFISTEVCESALIIPKRVKHNHRDVARTMACSMAFKQVIIPYDLCNI